MLWQNAHRVRLNSEVRKDLLWWSNFISTFNGWSTILDQYPVESVFTDACNEGAGGSFGGDWFYFNWSQDWPDANNFHINEKEVVAVVKAAYRWTPWWRNKRIIIYSDNTVTVSALSKGTCLREAVMKCIRSLFWLSASLNFHLCARFLPGGSERSCWQCFPSRLSWVPSNLMAVYRWFSSSFAHVPPSPPFSTWQVPWFAAQLLHLRKRKQPLSVLRLCPTVLTRRSFSIVPTVSLPQPQGRVRSTFSLSMILCWDEKQPCSPVAGKFRSLHFFSCQDAVVSK